MERTLRQLINDADFTVHGNLLLALMSTAPVRVTECLRRDAITDHVSATRDDRGKGEALRAEHTGQQSVRCFKREVAKQTIQLQRKTLEAQLCLVPFDRCSV